MSQEGVVDIIGTHPEIPTQFDANVGFAIPIANVLEVLGEVIPAAGVPFQSVASGNTVTYQVQYASAVAASDATAVGVSSFDSAFFTVDADGFVTFSGSSTTQLQVDVHTPPGTDPVVPLGGVITVTGAQVAAGVVGTNVIRTDSLAANTMTIEIQRSQAAAVSTVADNGVSHFDSAAFDVDANGFVQLNGGGIAATQFSPNSGTDPVVPTAAGLVNVRGTGSTTVVGSLNTLTVQLTGLTNHNVLVGAGSATITNVAPSATSGVPLISQGAAADPAFGTAVVQGGGTGATSFTAHSLLLGQGTSPITALGAATNGQLPIGSTGADPVLGNITSSGGTITVTNGAGTINIDLAGGGIAIDSFSPDSGTDPVVPTSGGLVNMKGSGSVTTVGSLNTVTFQLTGLTNHSVLVGAGTTTITKVAPSATSGIALVSNGSSADPSFTTVVPAGGGTGVTSWTDTNALLVTGTTSTGNVQDIASVATGQVLTSAGTSTKPVWSATPTVTSISFGGSALGNYTAYTSWTPGIAFGGGTTGITYSNQFGQYWRVGGVVFITGVIDLSNKGSSTGNATLTGLPITSKNDGTTLCYITISQFSNLTFTANYTTAWLLTQANTTTALIQQQSTTLGNLQFTNTAFANNTGIRFTGFYFADG